MAFDKDAFLSAMDSMSVMELNDLVKSIDEETDEAEAESGRIADQDLIDRLNRLDAGVGDRVSGGDSKDRPKVADRSREKVPAS